MNGSGFISHLGKDRFEVSNEGIGRDFKKIQVKLLKKDMVDILKKYGRDNKGKKDEVIGKFVEFVKKVPKIFKPIAVYKAGEAPAKADFIPLEEAVPQFKSKNIKIIPKATAVVYRSITRPKVLVPAPAPDLAEEPIKENLKGKTPEKILGLSKNATIDEIKKNYRFLSRKYHPDRTNSKQEQIIINRAYSDIMFKIAQEEEKTELKRISSILVKRKIKESMFIKNFFKVLMRVPVYNIGSDREYVARDYPIVMKIAEQNDLKEVALFAKDLYQKYME